MISRPRRKFLYRSFRRIRQRRRPPDVVSVGVTAPMNDPRAEQDSGRANHKSGDYTKPRRPLIPRYEMARRLRHVNGRQSDRSAGNARRQRAEERSTNGAIKSSIGRQFKVSTKRKNADVRAIHQRTVTGIYKFVERFAWPFASSFLPLLSVDWFL